MIYSILFETDYSQLVKEETSALQGDVGMVRQYSDGDSQINGSNIAASATGSCECQKGQRARRLEVCS